MPAASAAKSTPYVVVFAGALVLNSSAWSSEQFDTVSAFAKYCVRDTPEFDQYKRIALEAGATPVSEPTISDPTFRMEAFGLPNASAGTLLLIDDRSANVQDGDGKSTPKHAVLCTVEGSPMPFAQATKAIDAALKAFAVDHAVDIPCEQGADLCRSRRSQLVVKGSETYSITLGYLLRATKNPVPEQKADGMFIGLSHQVSTGR